MSLFYIDVINFQSKITPNNLHVRKNIQAKYIFTIYKEVAHYYY